MKWVDNAAGATVLSFLPFLRLVYIYKRVYGCSSLCQQQHMCFPYIHDILKVSLKKGRKGSERNLRDAGMHSIVIYVMAHA